ncbi:ribosylnicotinamide kinase [Aspergillus homomorphus CBS 101889]|uniref:P-loop containing nucleoside triphosphate hydrolase protein n=1 Tax=Aspergillus homomorphus (strain CBS 101889) TaxID=1450537 RepID=A0A395HQD7_ASPHC|nr:hypothetical protein BO97DRAFT_395672 [Aspergillus homomorphus CBS 101889]RAL09709.1 hypothetical protein BO97DRAFT_395672 [Aspergillus homomorphus CBS 101889]
MDIKRTAPAPAPVTPETRSKTIIIGISGPSSSGKTTLARLLQRIFGHLDDLPSVTEEAQAQAQAPAPALRSFLVHEDDFYHPDDKIPTITLENGTTLQNWDTASALDLGLLSASLHYIKAQGHLPPRLHSKEDQNEVMGDADAGVPGHLVGELRRAEVGNATCSSGTKTGTGTTIAFVEGFLLFAPPPGGSAESAGHPLREVHERFDGRLFLPAAYEMVKARRERRSGYVTIGAAPVPQGNTQGEGENGEKEEEEEEEEDNQTEIDLEAEDDRPPQNFWTDPPGYVDDIVWPNYVKDHAWLLLPEDESEDDDRLLMETDPHELVRLAGQATRVRMDAGVTVAPGRGSEPMSKILKWAVEEVLKLLEEVA